MSNDKNIETVDTKVRKIPKQSWELFKQHCLEESASRGYKVSCNQRLVEVIEVLGSRVEANKKKNGDEDSQPELDL